MRRKLELLVLGSVYGLNGKYGQPETRMVMNSIFGKSLLVFFFVMLASTTAFAQDPMPDAGEAMGGGDDSAVTYKKETNYDFDADDIDGALVKPDGDNIDANQHGRTSSLIRIRPDFIPEMLKSVEDI